MKLVTILFTCIVTLGCVEIVSAFWLWKLFGFGNDDDSPSPPSGWHEYSIWKVWFRFQSLPNFKNDKLNNAWNAMEQYGDQEKNEHRDADVTGGYWEYTLNDRRSVRNYTIYFKLIKLEESKQKRMILVSDNYPHRMKQKLYPLSYRACNFFKFNVEKYIPDVLCCTYEEFVELTSRMNKEAEELEDYPVRY